MFMKSAAALDMISALGLTLQVEDAMMVGGRFRSLDVPFEVLRGRPVLETASGSNFDWKRPHTRSQPGVFPRNKTPHGDQCTIMIQKMK